MTDTARNPLFLAVRDLRSHAPARALMQAVFDGYIDKDHSFVREFQTAGFSARVWELSLFAYFSESGARLEKPRSATPDFRLRDGTGVEAVTSNPPIAMSLPDMEAVRKIENPYIINDSVAVPEFQRQIRKAITNKMKHRFKPEGIPYWKLPEQLGKPFVLAVQAFYKDLAHAFTDAVAATMFLERGGIFDEPGMEHLSGVLFSNNSTIGQFNRIGLERGYASTSATLFRFGICFNDKLGSTKPAMFSYHVKEGEVREDFAQPLHLFRNPNALIPLPYDSFPRVRYTVRNFFGDLRTKNVGDFVPFASHTIVNDPDDPMIWKRR